MTILLELDLTGGLVEDVGSHPLERVLARRRLVLRTLVDRLAERRRRPRGRRVAGQAGCHLDVTGSGPGAVRRRGAIPGEGQGGHRLGRDVRRTRAWEDGLCAGHRLRRGVAAAFGQRGPDGRSGDRRVRARRPRPCPRRATVRPAPRVQERGGQSDAHRVHRSAPRGDRAPGGVGLRADRLRRRRRPAVARGPGA